MAVLAVVLVLGGGADDGDDQVRAGEPTDDPVPSDSADDADLDTDPQPEATPPSPALPPTRPEPTLTRIDPAWVGIIRSLDVNRVPYGRAVAEADDLTSRGIPADVLFSSNYSSMNPGYWVVYSGVFTNEDDARSHCNSIQPRLSNNCYQRLANGYRNVPLPS